jgi:hypothetical protein
MSDWRDQLEKQHWLIKEAEKKRSREERDKRRAERLREEDRYRQAMRKVFGMPGDETKQVRGREPINREAGRLIQKASEWAKPPPVQEQHKQKGKSKMAKGREIHQGGMREDEFFQGAHTASGKSIPSNSGIPRDANPEEYFSIHDLAVKVVAQINREPHQLTALARAAFDARNVLEENMSQIGPVMIDFNARVKTALEDVRQARMAVVGEIAHLLLPLKEVRQFFLGKDYDQEIARLKEFTSLCERLAALKKDGTLDAIADTIIKLAI